MGDIKSQTKSTSSTDDGKQTKSGGAGKGQFKPKEFEPKDSLQEKVISINRIARKSIIH